MLKMLDMLPISNLTANLVIRTEAATSLAGLCFLGGGAMAEMVGVMGVLEGIFSTSRTRGDILKKKPKLGRITSLV